MSGPDISIISESDDEVVLARDFERLEEAWTQVFISSEPVSSYEIAVGTLPQEVTRRAGKKVEIKSKE